MSLSVDRFDLAPDFTSLLIPQDTEEARQRWGARLNRLYPSSRIYYHSDYSDDLDVYGGKWPSNRQSVAYGLFTQFQEVLRMRRNGSERARLCSNYTLAQAIVTPVHRLPEELLTEVFMILKAHLDSLNPWIRYLLAVCRGWHSLLQHLPAFWSTLIIRQWTDKDYVHSFLSRGKNKPLDVIIYATGDSAAMLHNGQPYEALALVVRSAERLYSLTLKGSDRKVLGPHHTPLGNYLSNISVTAKMLTNLTDYDGYCTSILSQLSDPIIFSGLTHLNIGGSGCHKPVNFLPHLLVIQSLSLDRVSLADYNVNTPLPLVNTLTVLSLSYTSIQWMVGKEFKTLISCYIYFPHRHRNIRPMAVILPVCRDFAYQAQPLAGLRGFFIPPLGLSVLGLGNRNSDKSQNVMEIQHLRDFLLPQMPLASLILGVECHDQDLLGTLRLLPSLTALELRPRQPQSLGWRFFSGLLASMCYGERDCGHWWCTLFGGSVGQQQITICPLLESLVISYRRWLRNTEMEVVLPILPAIAESRRAAGKLKDKFVVEFGKTDLLNVWEIELEFPEVRVAYGAFQSAIHCHSIHLANPKPQAVLYLSHRPFSAFLHYISGLTISVDDQWPFPDPLDILSHCRRLKSLSLKGLPLQAYPVDMKLPLVDTLSTITLTETSLNWMSGRTFTLLKECRIVRPDPEECSKLFPVYLPLCTFLECQESPLGLVSKFRAPPPHSLMVGPIGFHLIQQFDPQSHLIGGWRLHCGFPSSYGVLTDELDVISHLRTAGGNLVWPDGETSRKLQAYSLVEQQLIITEVGEMAGERSSQFLSHHLPTSILRA